MTTQQPIITINGVRLSDSEASTVRVAVEHLAMRVFDKEADSDLGIVAVGYRSDIKTIRAAINQ